jgi:4-carboxymuconolactone decarboxylase
MSVIDPQERAERGAAIMAEVMGAPPAPKTPYEASVRDFLHAEVWSRPALDRRARFLTSLAGTASTGDADSCRAYMRGAMQGGYLSPLELREAALQLVVYSGWSTGGLFDRLLTEVLAELGLPEPICAPIQSAPISAADRTAAGQRSFENVARTPAPSPFAPYIDAGVLNFVMAEIWTRPGLDERGRRIVTLVGAGFSGSDTPMRVHSYSAMASGNLTRDEMLEFVLHFSIYGGWPRGSVFQRAVLEQAARVEKGLPFEI